MGRSLAGRASDYGEVQLPVFADRVFPEVAELAEHAARRIEAIASEAESLDADSESDESPVKKSAGELRGAADALRMAFSGSEESVASFERVESPYDRWRLAIRPVSPGSAFRESFMERVDSFAAVSASLFVRGDSFASMGELEIGEGTGYRVSTVSVESPFPYADNMRVVAMRPAADPIEETATVIAGLARQLGGRTLGLFTSLRRLNAVAERLDQMLRGEGFEVLAPRRAGDDPAALVRRFASSGGGTILLGARTFWQGLDLPGDGLQAVVIEKLPFEVPTELRKRREAQIKSKGGDAFGRFTLGKMLLHLKQMAGRLIRSETDRGIVVIVEARSDKRYFKRLADAFPPDTEIRLADPAELPAILTELGLGE
jgi:ATP-dependent DNA helicase DinG